MKRAALAILATAILLGFAVCLALPWYRAASSYNDLRDRLNREFGPTWSVKQVENEQLDDVMSSWMIGSTDDNQIGACLKMLGKPRTIESIVELINFRIPKYSWLNHRENKQNARLAMVSSMLRPISMDNTIYTSIDGNKALVYWSKGVAIGYVEIETGIRETRFIERQRH